MDTRVPVATCASVILYVGHRGHNVVGDEVEAGLSCLLVMSIRPHSHLHACNVSEHNVLACAARGFHESRVHCSDKCMGFKPPMS